MRSMRRYVEVRQAEDSAKNRQEKIMKYLYENPDVVKEDLVKALTRSGDGSRHTIYDAIDELEELKRVIVIRENRQLHRVSINPYSELNKINDLKDTFFDLIDEAVIVFRELNIKSKEDPVSDESHTLNHSSTSLAFLFEHMLSICILYFLFEWPKEFPDTKAREKLYELAFEAIKDIQFKLEEVFRIGDLELYQQHSIIEDLFILKRDRLYSTVKTLESAGLGERAKVLLDILWKFSLPFIPDAIYQMYEYHEHFLNENKNKIQKVLRSAKDWRNIMKGYSKSLSPDEKIWAGVPGLSREYWPTNEK